MRRPRTAGSASAQSSPANAGEGDRAKRGGGGEPISASAAAERSCPENRGGGPRESAVEGASADQRCGHSHDCVSSRVSACSTSSPSGPASALMRCDFDCATARLAIEIDGLSFRHRGSCRRSERNPRRRTEKARGAQGPIGCWRRNRCGRRHGARLTQTGGRPLLRMATSARSKATGLSHRSCGRSHRSSASPPRIRAVPLPRFAGEDTEAPAVGTAYRLSANSAK